MKHISGKFLWASMFAWLLAAALLIAVSTASGAALAAEVARPTSTHSGSSTDTYATNTSAEESGEYYGLQNPEEAAQVLRELMMRHTRTATLRFYIDIPFEQEYREQFWEAFDALEADMYQMAVAHTGDPKGGDYIYHGTSPYRWWEATVWGGDVTEVEVQYTFEYLTTPEQEAAADAAVEALLVQWDLDGASDYEKVRTVYDWFCHNVTYDYDGVEDDRHISHSAYAALVKKHCVCQGYSSAMYRVLLTLGVDNRVLYGMSDGESHSWNLVKLGGKYYLADATWDASWVEAGLEYEWFLRGEPNFPTHDIAQEQLTEEFRAAYPISQEDYDPNAQTIPSGTCGDNLTWVLTEDGTLTISGTGAMYDYNGYDAPWYELRSSITHVTLEEGVESIGHNAFRECDTVESIAIAETVTKIGNNAFQYCTGLRNVQIPGSVTFVGWNTFDGCTSLEWAKLHEGVTAISNNMFKECRSLVDVTIPESVTIIGDEAFENCVALPRVEIPSGVQMIGGSAFQGCTELWWVDLYDGLEIIGGSAFQSCTSLVQITVPATVVDIADYAFAFCEKLEKIWFQGDAPCIGMHSFYSDRLNGFYPANKAGWEAAIAEFYGGNITWAAYGEGEETFAFTGTSISLGESLDIHFFLSDYEVESTDYAVITRTYADGREDHVVTVPYGEWDALGDGRLYITYHGIAAKEMNDTVSVVVYNQDGTPASQEYTDSVQDYAMRLLHSISIDGAPQILVVDMLNYGTEAQLFFGYDTENLANAELVSAERDYASEDYLVEDHLKYSEGRAGTALTLKSRLSLDMYFADSVIGEDYSSLYAVITYSDHYGNPIEMAIPGDAFVKENGRCYVQVTGLAIADYRQQVTCSIYDSDGNVLAWATDSVEGYIARMDGKIPGIVGALAKFGNIAYYYFHTYLQFVGGAVENPGVIR